MGVKLQKRPMMVEIAVKAVEVALLAPNKLGRFSISNPKPVAISSISSSVKLALSLVQELKLASVFPSPNEFVPSISDLVLNIAPTFAIDKIAISILTSLLPSIAARRKASVLPISFNLASANVQ